MKKVVLAIIPFNNKFVAVSKRYDYNILTLPGGKVEECESVDAALDREVSEETGLQVVNKELFNISVYDNYQTFCYLVKEYKGELKNNADLILANEGITKYVDYTEILNKGLYSDYNSRIFEMYFEYINSNGALQRYFGLKPNGTEIETYLVNYDEYLAITTIFTLHKSYEEAAKYEYAKKAFEINIAELNLNELQNKMLYYKNEAKCDINTATDYFRQANQEEWEKYIKTINNYGK